MKFFYQKRTESYLEHYFITDDDGYMTTLWVHEELSNRPNKWFKYCYSKGLQKDKYAKQLNVTEDEFYKIIFEAML